MQRHLTAWTYATAAVAGAVAALTITLFGDWLGAFLESAFSINLRSWELAVLQFMLVNVPAGAIIAILGAFVRKPHYGVGIGVAMQTFFLSAFYYANDSLQAAPSSVVAWGVLIGVLAGSAAGALGTAAYRWLVPKPLG